jgi:hypothetical protein
MSFNDVIVFTATPSGVVECRDRNTLFDCHHQSWYFVSCDAQIINFV